MQLLMVGDVMGKGGRRIVRDRLPGLRERLRLDFVVVNGENAAHGRGITPGIAEELFKAGADVITLGDHAFDEPSVLAFLEQESRLLRPLNIAPGAPGAGARSYETGDGRIVHVLNALGRVFLSGLYADPFEMVGAELERAELGRQAGAVLLDFHAEATSEKMAMGHWCDGRASLVAGTHTHVPTADFRILPGGTAYATDIGMCGSYDSVIGMRKDEPLARFVTGMRSGRFEPETGDPMLSAVCVETDDRTGLAVSVDAVRVGGVLPEVMPCR